MNYFQRVRVQGFRRLHDVDLRLTPLNVLIGANGAGKTSLLDVFTLLSNSRKERCVFCGWLHCCTAQG